MDNITNIGIDKDGDIIFITCAKYKLFLNHGEKGGDAYRLYSHLMFTARLQETNQVKANNVYLRNGLKWGKERLQNAKTLLKELELIEEIQKHNPDGTFADKYIRVKTISEPLSLIPAAGSTVGRSQTTNALTNNINALTNNINALTKKRNSKQFVPPLFQEVDEYIKSKGYNVNANLFYDYYSAGNWTDSQGNPVKNWKQRIITWHNRENNKQNKKTYQDELNERYGQ